MRQTKQRKALQIGRFLAWLPMGAVAVLTIALIAKLSTGSWFETRAKSPPAAASQKKLPPEMLFGDMDFATGTTIQAGIWSVANSNWNFQNESVSDQHLAQAMRAATDSGSRVESDAPEHLALIDLIPAERASVEQFGTLTTRSVDFGNVQASVCYRETAGQRYFLNAKFANQIDARQ